MRSMLVLFLISQCLLSLNNVAGQSKGCSSDDDCVQPDQGCSDEGKCVCKNNLVMVDNKCSRCSSNADCVQPDQGCSDERNCVSKNNLVMVGDTCSECKSDEKCVDRKCISGKCVCKEPGLVWDWIKQKCRGCEESDECEPFHQCLDGKCECIKEYYWLPVEKRCGACKESNDCGQNKECFEVFTPRRCMCREGFIWNSKDEECKEISCDDNPCGGNFICKPGEGGELNCECPDGQFSDGYTCHDTPCYSNPCHNGGTCQKHDKSFSCLCPIGFSGTSCEDAVKPGHCTEGDCQNKGQCKNSECKCSGGFTGPFCEEIKCKVNADCFNEGTCSGGECTCTEDYTGVYCEVSVHHSYLHYPRIHFAGSVKADPSTINNYVQNWNASTEPSFRPHIPGWDPKGSGVWRIQDVQVTAACDQNRFCYRHAELDPVVGAFLKDTAGRASAKLVDFDVELQIVSKIYGWTIEVDNFFKGNFDPVPFQYMWEKSPSNDDRLGRPGAVYQSILDNVQFGYRSEESNVVKFFKRNVDNQKIKLSIHFNIDLYSSVSKKDSFTIARIVGSIGLSGPHSPPYFTLGRLLEPAEDPAFWYAPFVFEKRDDRHHIVVDFGNTFLVDAEGSVIKNAGQFRFGLQDDSQIIWVGKIWNLDNYDYNYTSGIMDIPIEKVLDEELLERQLVLFKLIPERQHEVILAESKDGIVIHPFTQWTLRLDTDDNGNEVSTPEVYLFMTKFGKIVCEDISVESDPAYIDDSPFPRTPAMEQPSHNCVLGEGKIGGKLIKVTFERPKGVESPRRFIDGQVYTFQYYHTSKIDTKKHRFKAYNSMIALFVYSSYTKPTKPCWLRHIRPIFQQYATLYPVMKIHFFDLSNYQEVVKNKRGIIRSMRLDEKDPNYMPVTRDLSKTKQNMILNWLAADQPCYGGNVGMLKSTINVAMLKHLLQTALRLEHATIPPYLSGYLSLKKSHNTEVKAMMKGILISEMFHLAQVANILNAIGGHPDLLAPDFVPSYPSYLPGGVHPDHRISVNKMSTLQIRDAYMVIEQPSKELEERGLMEAINKFIEEKHPKKRFQVGVGSAQSSGDTPKVNAACTAIKTYFVSAFGDAEGIITNHNTIGELYTKILIVLSILECQGKIPFNSAVPQVELGDEVFKVDSYRSAVRAIETIISEGEGASACNPLDDETELSHYYKFGSMVNRRHVKTFGDVGTGQAGEVASSAVVSDETEHCKGTFAYTGRYLPFNEEGVWPIVEDPKMTMYRQGSRARFLASQFNDTYFDLLKTIQHVFDGEKHDHTLDDSFGIMKQLLVIGDELVQVPIQEGGNPNVGPNAGPIYPSYP